MRRVTIITFSLSVTFLAAFSLAEDQLIDVRVDDRVRAGKPAVLSVSVLRPLASLKLSLRRDDGVKVERRQEDLAAGSVARFELPAGKGRHRWRGELAVGLPEEGGGSMKLDFETEVVESLGLSVDRRQLDLKNGSLVLLAERPLAKVAHEVLSESGKQIGRATSEIKPPARMVTLRWQAGQEKVLKISILATDAAGLSEPLELIPWTYNIPHEEVVFPTGSWEILAEQQPKLEQSYEILQVGIKKYGRLLEVKLYIAGHTDTVAAADYNQQLSEKRARSIAAWFRERGFSCPVFYQGFGEKALKVPTPDETDEPRNRRAEYVLAAEPPPLDIAGADAGWKKL